MKNIYQKLLFIHFFFISQAFGIKLIYESETLAINPANLTEAIEKNSGLSELNHFDPKFYKDKKWQKKVLKEENIKKVCIQTKDDISVSGYFVDRGADKAILIGQGFLSPKEVLIPFFKLFPNYDILILDYRWKKWHKKSILKRLDSFVGTLKKYIYDAKNEVCAAVKYLRSNPRYKSVTGIGQCYSGLVFTIAQVTKLERRNERLFDNLIIDSGFFSTKAVLKRILDDPKLCWENKHGGAPGYVRFLTGNRPVTMLFSTMARLWLGENFTKLSMDTYLPNLKNTKLLFIHGEKDLLIPYSDFENMYKSATQTERCALITQSTHTSNHFEEKENYAYFVDKFIQAGSVSEFVNNIKNS